MHLLRLFLMAWLSLGIVSVFLLFWLCKRTAARLKEPSELTSGAADVSRQSTNALDKPVLHREMLQQLLAAAYTLREQNKPLVHEAKADSTQTVSLTELPQESVLRQSDVEPLAPFNTSTVPSSRARMVRRPTPQSDVSFWRIATAVAIMAAFSALLVVASGDRLSPLPAGLILPSEVVQQEVPFRRGIPIVTDLAQGGGVGAKTVVMEQATKTGPTRIERSVVANKPLGGTTPASVQKILNPKRYSTYESEGDVIAQDTVVRYTRHTPLR
jgi:hypothetical protein